MPILHLFLTFLVVLVWGVNFVFVKISLLSLSPVLLGALRFVFVAFPAILFVPFPKASAGFVMHYGLVMFALQFSLLFAGLSFGMTAGMASVIMQMQVFFSMIFAVIFLKETPQFMQLLGALVSFSGILIVGKHVDAHVSALGVMFVLMAACVWGWGNTILKKGPKVPMMPLLVWGCFFSAIPLTLLQWYVEGWHHTIVTLTHAPTMAIIAVLYTTFISTFIGYGIWNWLLVRYPLGMLAPYALLIPIIGLASSVIFMGEPLLAWKIWAGILVISGIFINFLGKGFIQIFSKMAQNAL